MKKRRRGWFSLEGALARPVWRVTGCTDPAAAPPGGVLVGDATYRATRDANGPQTSGAPKDGDVVDAEFRNVDDKKS